MFVGAAAAKSLSRKTCLSTGHVPAFRNSFCGLGGCDHLPRVIGQPILDRLGVVSHEQLHETHVKWLYPLTIERRKAQNSHMVFACYFNKGQIVRVHLVHWSLLGRISMPQGVGFP